VRKTKPLMVWGERKKRHVILRDGQQVPELYLPCRGEEEPLTAIFVRKENPSFDGDKEKTL